MHITTASEKGVESCNQSSEHCLAFWLSNACFLWAQSEMRTKQLAHDDDKRIDSWTHHPLWDRNKPMGLTKEKPNPGMTVTVRDQMPAKDS